MEQNMSQFWTRFIRPGLDQVVHNLSFIGGKPIGSLVWKRLTFLVATPAIGLCMINAYYAAVGAAENQRREFIKYDHLRRRTKRFPWGNGERSLFHNREVNALTEGYEA
ncbi:cytochrome c oxidase subunit 6A2, mitochondrial [Drosophila busckii]|nr:cytochrome c oxidase subunit 6A2, mitochondrial [Drosophila busckii]XP_017836870.1 cytochrome c oxidase subunit 6A2, mitochondrial [Drosophila busckii]